MKLKKFISTSSFILISGAVYAQYGKIVMCRACPVGYVGNGSSTKCTGCSAGTYQDQIGQKNCKDIPAGNCATGAANSSYKTCLDKDGRTACSASDCSATGCSAGYYLSGGECHSCTEGYYCPGDNERHICNAGQYSTSGSSSCTNCPAGSYSSSSGSSSCTSCSYPYYQPNEGQTSCPNYCDTTTPSCTNVYKTITPKTCYKYFTIEGCTSQIPAECEGKKSYDCSTCSTSSGSTNYGTANTWTTSSCTGYSSPTCSYESC